MVRKLSAKINKNPCASSPCANNTICVSLPNEKGFKCNETQKYTAENQTLEATTTELEQITEVNKHENIDMNDGY